MNLPIERIIEELSRPSAWPDLVDSVEVRQTHISIIFLAGETVFKVKKPVDFGFLDFTTLRKRHHFCEEEVRLNRRLSPDIYLGVQPVTEEAGILRFGGQGKHLEYAVRMIRLDEDTFLSTLLEKGKAGKREMKRIAEKVADFHSRAETTEEITSTGGTKAVIFNTEENFQQIEPYIGDTLSEDTFRGISGYTRSYLEANMDLFTRREKDGFIRDCHGDLHTQHISLADDIRIFDCIEFNQRFRYGDILSDAAFLAMDLDRLGFNELAGTFRDEYLERSDQKERLGLMNFYACYRAVVRGKVEGFRSRDPNVDKQDSLQAAESSRTFHALALGYARTPAPPVLIIACGLMGTGKTTCARALEELIDIEILSSDKIRKELAGIEPTATRHVPFRKGIYSEKMTKKVYGELHRRAKRLLLDGRSVFIDASYMDPSNRKAALDAAVRSGVRALLVHFGAERAEIEKRLRKRVGRESEISDGREEILDRQMDAFHPPDEVPAELLLSVDTTRGPDDAVRKIYLRLLSTT